MGKNASSIDGSQLSFFPSIVTGLGLYEWAYRKHSRINISVREGVDNSFPAIESLGVLFRKIVLNMLSGFDLFAFWCFACQGLKGLCAVCEFVL